VIRNEKTVEPFKTFYELEKPIKEKGTVEAA
jgi:hypothetical protein